MQTDAVWNLLAEQIEHGWDESLPKPAPNPDDLYRPTLIGAWSKNRLVGGAFVMPDSQDAKAFTSIGADKAAQAFERSCCMIQGVAVAAEHRREGIGLKIKRCCDLWAAQHDACIVLSIPTNAAAARMNEKAGYDVLPPQVALCVEVTDDDRGIVCCFPMGVPYSRAAPMGTPRHRPVPYDGIGRALRRSRDRMDVPRRHHAMTSSSLRSAPHSKSGFSSLIVFLSDCRSGSRSRRAPIPAPSRRRASLRVACIRMRRTV